MSILFCGFFLSLQLLLLPITQAATLMSSVVTMVNVFLTDDCGDNSDEDGCGMSYYGVYSLNVYIYILWGSYLVIILTCIVISAIEQIEINTDTCLRMYTYMYM